MTVIACAMFAYCVNTIGSIFQDMALKEGTVKKKIFIASEYMNLLNVKADIQS